MKQKRSLKQIQYPTLGFDADGKPLQLAYNSQQLADRKKIMERVGKIDAAMADAFSESKNWEPLSRLMGGKQESKKQEQEKQE